VKGGWPGQLFQRLWKPALVLVLLLGGYWLVPISGQVLVIPGGTTPALLWPHMRLEPPALRPGAPVTLWVTDVAPWANVLLTLDGQPLPLLDWRANTGGTWTWRWTFTLSDVEGHTLVFYHSCHTGCVERGRMTLGTGSAAPPPNRVPTKLGVVFASPGRNWHGRSGWDVELTYARLADQEYWGIDDLATRVRQAGAQGLRVLVRVDYAQGQSLPPANDYVALSEYLQYLQRLARDDRLRSVYGYIIGSGTNALDSNTLAPDRPVTPAWYARVFNGYGEAPTHADNAVQVIRGENPLVRVLVGPVRPWNADQDGERRYAIDVPWLNYMNTLVALLDESARTKAVSGIPLAAPDGFAVNAPGRPGAVEWEGEAGADEPRIELRRAEWGEAQAGFRIYRDWLAIINAYPTTQGVPVYITATNTFAPDEGTVPAQNYVRGWLTTALEVIEHEPQVQALCWFIDEDRSGDTRWDWFSLTRHPGRLIDAAEEFDMLLQR